MFWADESQLAKLKQISNKKILEESLKLSLPNAGSRLDSVTKFGRRGYPEGLTTLAG